MKAFGAEIVQVTQAQGMEYARDLADQMQLEGKGRVLNQFANPDRALRAGMVALVTGEVGGFGVLLAGFIAGQF